MLALRAGNKIEAIKLLRQHAGLDLKDSKDRIDAAVEKDPALKQAAEARRREIGVIGPLLKLLYHVTSFLLVTSFLVILFSPGFSFMQAGKWLDSVLKSVWIHP